MLFIYFQAYFFEYKFYILYLNHYKPNKLFEYKLIKNVFLDLIKIV